MITTFEETMFFKDISIYQRDISKSKYFEFMELVIDEDLPDEYVVDLPELTFQINQVKREIRILKRNYSPRFSDDIIDYSVYLIYKVATKSKFKFFFENKYNN
jgi:hypothetical protein